MKMSKVIQGYISKLANLHQKVKKITIVAFYIYTGLPSLF